MTRYTFSSNRKRSALRSASRRSRRSSRRSASRSASRRSRRSASRRNRRSASRRNRRHTRTQSGGNMFSVLKTALLPFLFYKAQKTQQKRVIKKKQKTRKLRRRR